MPMTQITPYGGVMPTIKNPCMASARGVVRESFQKWSLDNLTVVAVKIKPLNSKDKKEDNMYSDIVEGSPSASGSDEVGPDAKRAKTAF